MTSVELPREARVLAEAHAPLAERIGELPDLLERLSKIAVKVLHPLGHPLLSAVAVCSEAQSVRVQSRALRSPHRWAAPRGGTDPLAVLGRVPRRWTYELGRFGVGLVAAPGRGADGRAAGPAGAGGGFERECGGGGRLRSHRAGGGERGADVAEECQYGGEAGEGTLMEQMGRKEVRLEARARFMSG